MTGKNILATVCKAVTALSAAATAIFFFFNFFVINGELGVPGVQMVFGGVSNGVATYKSMWYFTAFWLAIITLVLALAFIFKGIKSKKYFKSGKYWTLGSSALLMINMIVLYCAPTFKTYFDVRGFGENIANKDIVRQPALTIVFILSIVAFVLAVVTMFVTDYVEVAASNGAKLTIFSRIKNFFKDYKSEITKIVWPSGKNVFRNVVVVIAMCAIIGLFIWAVDFGLAKLLGLILGIEL